MTNRRAAFVLLVILGSFLVAAPAVVVRAESGTIVVRDDYGSIQEAINNASEGDTVYVKKGTYHENVVVNKSVSLVGEDFDTTIIDGNPSEGFRIPVQIQADNVSVSGCKLLYGWAGITVGEVKFCSISGNRIAGATNGIKFVYTSDSNITGNIFEGIGLSSAIQLSYATNNLVKGNYIDSCVEGIQIWLGSDNNSIVENRITKCSEHALGFQYSDNNMVSRNNISDSGVGTAIYVSNLNVISHNNYFNNAVQFASDSNESYAMTFGYNISVNNINENYWSDYNGTDSDGDGIGDTAYIIDENNQDNNPLTEPTIIPEFPSWAFLPLLLAATVFIVVCKRRITKHTTAY